MKLDSTPGPWSTTESNNGFNDAKGESVPHSSCFIEEAYCGTDATPESIANDRLIAAAPEMSDALIDFKGDMYGHGIDADPEMVELLENHLEIMTAIIEKATGKTWEELNA